MWTLGGKTGVAFEEDCPCLWLGHRQTETVLFFLIFIVIQLQLYAFSSHPSTPPQETVL